MGRMNLSKILTRAKECVAVISSFLEADIGDLTGRGVHLAVVIAVELFMQDISYLRNLSDVFQGAGADDAILQPAVRPLNLSLGLG